jgi:transposase InsO family protein
MGKENKRERAKQLGVSRSSLYYARKKPQQDWALKCAMEEVLRCHPSYGHRRLAIALGVNKKRTLRVMKLFGIQPYRRRGRKWRKPLCKPEHVVSNLLMTTVPLRPHHIWATDFTHVDWKSKRLFIATMMDLHTRAVTGFSVLTNHSVHLVINALFSGIHKHPAPEILHSDRGSEYTGKDMRIILELLGAKQSMSRAGCPWENGYQESFYSQFKVDLGDPNRFPSLGELVYEIYRLIHSYNTNRIHTALRMPPQTFSLRYATTQFLIPSNVS